MHSPCRPRADSESCRQSMVRARTAGLMLSPVKQFPTGGGPSDMIQKAYRNRTANLYINASCTILAVTDVVSIVRYVLPSAVTVSRMGGGSPKHSREIQSATAPALVAP